eukprot:2707962-Amphidinium_carterae.1
MPATCSTTLSCRVIRHRALAPVLADDRIAQVRFTLWTRFFALTCRANLLTLPFLIVVEVALGFHAEQTKPGEARPCGSLLKASVNLGTIHMAPCCWKTCLTILPSGILKARGPMDFIQPIAAARPGVLLVSGLQPGCRRVRHLRSTQLKPAVELQQDVKGST